MVGFSANLGFLWTELALCDAVDAAALAGFDAIECHAPYDTPPEQLRRALSRNGLPLLAINTRRGETFGLAAVPGQSHAARASIGEAVIYARAAGAGAVHFLAGRCDGPEAAQTYLENLAHACDTAPDLTILIEPLNAADAPGYFLKDAVQAAQVIESLRRPNLKIMFDCYHVARTEGDVMARLRAVFPLIGHVQIAGVPDRGRPDRGTLDYRQVFKRLDALGWSRPVGAEYRPEASTGNSLGWMNSLRS